jgi:hypothetical protein
MAKLAKGDTVSMTGEVTRLNDDGTVTVRLLGYDVPVTSRGEHSSPIVKRKVERRKPLYDKPD